MKDVPRAGLKLFLRIKNLLIGEKFNVASVLRAVLISFVLTGLAMPIGRALGLYLYGVCRKFREENYSGVSLSFSDSFSSALGYYSPVQFSALMASNIFFDLITVFGTVAILLIAIKKRDAILATLIAFDIALCLILLHGLWFIADKFDTGGAVTQFGIFETLPTVFIYLRSGCAGFELLLTKIFFASTILIPTLIYLIAIFVIAVLRGGFVISRWIGLHVLERSVEDERKSVIGHASAALGIIVALGGAVRTMAQIV